MNHIYAGSELAITVVVFTWAGHWLDKHFHWEPWGLVAGAIVGIALGLYSFIGNYVRKKN